MTTTRVKSYAEGHWHEGTGTPVAVYHAVTGAEVGQVSAEGLDYAAMLAYGRKVGGPALQRLTFHQRALMLKELAKYLMERKDEFYAVSAATGATKTDSWIDIEGGIGTFFVYSSKGRREMPDDTVYVDGPLEPLSRGGTFVGRHVCVPLQGTAVHINAFNFPCWGMLEKLAPTFLAGMPAIVKPATLTCYLTEAMVRAIIESKILPEGALQLICGSTGDLFDHLTNQDVVTFTGSAWTGKKLKGHASIQEHNIRFNMEADSLNCSILGPDCTPDTDEFALFIKEVANEMTVKAGQKCTAIRRAIVPRLLVDDVKKALTERLAKCKVGDPAAEGVRMGPLAGRAQVKEVGERVAQLREHAELVVGGGDSDFEVVGADREKGAFFPTTVLYCDDPFNKTAPHDVEAFGPVTTLLPYGMVDEACALAAMGKGSLVGSLFTADDNVARQVVMGIGPHHGRLVLINRHCAKESTGHGSPMPHMIHGGPGRAGGGEEMGGVRGVMHFMQRVALTGSPQTLTAITNQWMRGANQPHDRIHPFRKYFDELQIGDTLTTHRRTVTEADIVNFAGVSGDTFYAHTDEIAAKESFFGKRVAHGYFVLAAAAGLFVDPAPGPVLANYGLEDLRFVEPVYAGDTIHVKLTVKQKAMRPKVDDQKLQGTVWWNVDVINQNDVMCANYTLLTLVERQTEPPTTA
ncbi:MAG: phenylacetic acid degradation bifunctional protein PaaZ [Planctomycetota bacterium]